MDQVYAGTDKDGIPPPLLNAIALKGSLTVAFSRKVLRMVSSGFTVKALVLVRMLFGSDVVVAAGVAALAVSAAVTLGL
jgi:hypothetical protein